MYIIKTYKIERKLQKIENLHGKNGIILIIRRNVLKKLHHWFQKNFDLFAIVKSTCSETSWKERKKCIAVQHIYPSTQPRTNSE